MTRSRNMAALERTLEHRFQRPGLLLQALTHSSYAREARDSNGEGSAGDNEQMEFLGDSILSLVASEELFRRFPAFDEGELSKTRAHLVSAPALTRAAARLKLGGFLRLGRGEEMSGGRKKPALLADAFEAVVAALYLEAGLPAARRLVLAHLLEPELLRREKIRDRSGAGLPVTDFKSALQEQVQALGAPAPSYALIREEGPQHKKIFTVEARIRTAAGAERSWQAQGASKKLAEQGAARQALRSLRRRKPAPRTRAASRSRTVGSRKK